MENKHVLVAFTSFSVKIVGMGSTSLHPPRRNHNGPASSLIIRNVVVAGHRTSVRLEPQMWEALRDIANQLQVTIHDLVTRIDRTRTTSSLTAGIRVYIVDFYRAAAFSGGHPPRVPTAPLPVRDGAG